MRITRLHIENSMLLRQRLHRVRHYEIQLTNGESFLVGVSPDEILETRLQRLLSPHEVVAKIILEVP